MGQLEPHRALLGIIQSSVLEEELTMGRFAAKGIVPVRLWSQV